MLGSDFSSVSASEVALQLGSVCGRRYFGEVDAQGQVVVSHLVHAAQTTLGISIDRFFHLLSRGQGWPRLVVARHCRQFFPPAPPGAARKEERAARREPGSGPALGRAVSPRAGRLDAAPLSPLSRRSHCHSLTAIMSINVDACYGPLVHSRESAPAGHGSPPAQPRAPTVVSALSLSSLCHELSSCRGRRPRCGMLSSWLSLVLACALGQGRHVGRHCRGRG